MTKQVVIRINYNECKKEKHFLLHNEIISRPLKSNRRLSALESQNVGKKMENREKMKR